MRKEIIEYSVLPGENLLTISQKFGISLDTLYWANNLNKNSVLKPGQKLIILPVSGILHYVKSGDTLLEIAKTYQADLKEIIVFNDLSGPGDIFIGDILVIPNGKKPIQKKVANGKKPIQKKVAKIFPEIPLARSYFLPPVSLPYKISQGLHWYNAVDFDGQCGDPVYAPAPGIVQRVKYGWNGGAGNYLTILHPNQIVTFYGHLKDILVSPGQNLSPGQIIALIGGQPGTPGAGRTTGCHLHFGVQGAKNPFAR